MILVLLAGLLFGSGCTPASRSPTPPASAVRTNEDPARAARELEELTRRLDALGSRSSDLENALARLGARVEALERGLDQLAAQLAHARASSAPSAAGGAPAVAAPSPPTSRQRPEPLRAGAAGPGASSPAAQGLYQAGMAKYRAGEPAAAALIFYDLITRYPSDPLRERAQFQMADIFLRDKDLRGALREFEDLLAAVPNGAKTTEALLKVGLCYRGLGDEASARRAWERLAMEYPASAASRQARALLRASRPR